jgi:prolipoprotein diacylglyceryl transferase
VDATVTLAAIPSPTQGVWHLGPFPIRAYALCIVLGIVAACVITEVRMRRRGAPPYLVLDIALWAVLFGIVGARLYHVLTSLDSYFGEGADPIEALKIWRGGLGIWGAISGGALGAWIACRRIGIPLRFVADAFAPGLPVAQAIGRVGNWFNNELYGKETDLPWGLKIYNWDASTGQAVKQAGTDEPILRGIYHPAFLYELLWCLAAALAIWLLDRKYKFGRGRAFALYVMMYCVGRFWIETLRIDESHVIGGMRLNNWTSIIVFLGALLYFLRVKGPREMLVVEEDGTIRVVDEGTAVTAASSSDASDESSSEDGPPEVDDAAEPDGSDKKASDDEDDSAAARPTTSA